MLLAVGLLALLPVLAVLQYRWLGEVSQGERERMRRILENSAAQFCQEFDRELSYAYLAFQGQAMDPADLAERHRRWMENAQHPALIGAIYQASFGPAGESVLERFRESDGALERIEWPDKLAAVRDAFNEQHRRMSSSDLFFNRSVGVDLFKMQREQHASGGQTRVQVKQTVIPAMIQLSIGPVNDEIPALVVPIVPVQGHSPLPAFPLGRPIAQRIVTLNLDYIRQSFIPELIKRHFAEGQESEYRFSIVRNAGAQSVIFESENGAAKFKGDVVEPFMRLRLGEPNRLLLGGPLFAGETSPSATGRSSVTSIIVQSDVKAASGERPQIVDDVLKTVLPGRANGAWRLSIQHRAGSLEEAVANARRRNLAVSFGILLLLVISVGFILLSSRRAQRLAEQQMEFVAGVSHELRTPIAVICSAAENLADGVIDNREQIKRYGSLIRDEGRRLTGMVEQVLEFAGAQSGKKTFDLKPTDLHAVIDDAVTACHLQMAEGGFELEQQIPAELPAVDADADSLSRAIQNLLGNAMKYSGESRWIGLRVESGTDEVAIHVSDRGIGIPSAERSHIFEPFYRGRSVVAAQIHGNGLGLSLVKHIVDAHHGSIQVESEPNQGTTFTLRLRAFKEDAPLDLDH